jgi:conjugal transfer ATP-binding protein TraC
MFSDALRQVAAWFHEPQEEQLSLNQAEIRAREAALNLNIKTLTSLLPYETIDESLIFHNKSSIGFAMELAPFLGADEALVKTLADFISNKVLVDIDVSIMLYKNRFIAESLETGLSQLAEKGGIYAELGDSIFANTLTATKAGFANNKNLKAGPCNYRAFWFFSIKNSSAALESLLQMRQSFEAEFRVLGAAFKRLDAVDFTKLVQNILNPNSDAFMENKSSYKDNKLIAGQLLHSNTLYQIADDKLTVETTDATGASKEAVIVNLSLDDMPESFALWQTPDLFANLLNPEYSIPCDFLSILSFRMVDSQKSANTAKMKSRNLSKNLNAIQKFLNPKIVDEARDWAFAHDNNILILPCFINLMLITSKAAYIDDTALAISAYRKLGFELRQAKLTQFLRFLGSLPFMLTEGLFEDLRTLDIVKSYALDNVVNLLPIIAGAQGSRAGLALQGYRNNLAFLDLFDDKTLPITNYNFLVIGSSGAGKSMFSQALLLSGIAAGELTFVIDLGESYRHLCELLGGTYIDATTLALNPFTLFDIFGSDVVDGNMAPSFMQIRDLLSIMASPNEPILEVQKAYLLDALSSVIKSYGRDANIDAVVTELGAMLTKAPESDQRLSDLITLLEKYTTRGIYGHIFNGKTANFSNSKFIVFEMGGFAHNKELLTIVMFVMITIIQGLFYNSDRNIKKRCIIDEAWRFLTEGANPIAANFIEQGFRTARKHRGGFGVITQYLMDSEKTLQGQAIAASSDIKIIMRQGNFKDYLKHNPNRFSELQQTVISNFPDAKNAGFASFMLEAGNYHGFYRYYACPKTRLLFSSAGDDFAKIKALKEQGLSISAILEGEHA